MRFDLLPRSKGKLDHWSFTPQRGAAVYGRTARLSSAPLDDLAHGHFLRVPYRRVPIIEVDSVAALRRVAARILAEHGGERVLWRGQPQEHYLERSHEDLLRLFGSIAVREPSLIPSADRSELDFFRACSAWVKLLDVYVVERASRLFASQALREIEGFRKNYDFWLWAFAMAQHYGLPSVGIDVTTDLSTAVLFALHEFRTAEGDSTRVKRVGVRAAPVVYAMGGFEEELYDDEVLAPSWLQSARSRAQGARFLGAGWSVATNRAAERILVALRLVNHVEWRLPRGIDELFPSAAVDPFLAFLFDARERFGDVAEEACLRRVYSSHRR
jgi:hypothetical protein